MVMENLDILLLTTVVSVLFLVFIIATFREITEDSKTAFKGGKERGPRADMIEFVGRIFSDDSIKPNEKKELLDIIKKKITDVEVDEKPKDD